LDKVYYGHAEIVKLLNQQKTKKSNSWRQWTI
jgi:hypothetical protein